MTVWLLLIPIVVLLVTMPGILGTEDIGTGQTYTTIAAWETAIPADITADKCYTGQCLGEVFSETVTIDGHTTDSTHYITLMAKDGNEHDGRAHDVSAVGNARVIKNSGHVVQARDNYCRISWLEAIALAGASHVAATSSVLTAGITYVHHNILHGDSQGLNGWYSGDGGSDVYVYRNIIYGVDEEGLDCSWNANASALLQNTIYECNQSNNASYGGLENSGAANLVKGNAVMDNNQADWISSGAGVNDYNCDSDGTETEGANTLNNKVSTNQFVNATTTWANTDLLPKAGADILAAGTSFATGTYPEIDESIDNRGVSITGTWDIGAGQYVAAGGTSARRRRLLCA